MYYKLGGYFQRGKPEIIHEFIKQSNHLKPDIVGNAGETETNR